MTGNIIAVWGSPNSGKTTFSTKLASTIYEKYKKTVIVLYTDMDTPVLPVMFPNFKSEHLASVGTALSKPEILQDDVIQSLVTIKGKQNYGFLGFRDGENKYTFPRFSEGKVEDLLDTLAGISDYVIVDCASNLEINTMSAVAVNRAEYIFRLASPDLKAVSWHLSQLPIYTDKRYRLNEHIQGINIPSTDVFMPLEEMKSHMRDLTFIVPYSHAIKEQMQEGRLYLKSTDRNFEVCMNRIAERIVVYGTE